MYKIYSAVDNTKLLHLVNRMEEIHDRTDLAESHQFLQLATLRMGAGKTFRPHQHIWKPAPTEQVIAQESWVVIKGRVKVFFYDIDGTLLDTQILEPGDCSMTFEGGHTYEILAEDTVVYEYKTGPYQGQELDKAFI